MNSATRPAARLLGLLIAGTVVVSVVFAGEDTKKEARWPIYSVSSTMYHSLGLEEFLAEASRLGCTHVDVWGNFGGHKGLISEIRTLGPEKTNALLKKYKVKIYAFTVYGSRDSEKSEYLTLLGAVGGKVLVFGDYQGDAAKAVARVADLAREARAQGLYVAVENHGRATIGSLAELRAFIKAAAPHSNLGVAAAPHHTIKGGESVPEFIEICGEKLYFVYGWQKGRGLRALPGPEGYDFTPVLASLKKVKFPGPINIFTHVDLPPAAMSEAVAKSIEYLDALDGKPGAAVTPVEEWPQPLADKPFFQYRDGREAHRFSDHAVNDFRLYDFYARQAAWHRAHPEEEGNLLLPLPGLGSGLHGHWGLSNKWATSSHRFQDQDVKPPMAKWFRRNGGAEVGHGYARIGTADHPALMGFDQRRIRLVQVDLDIQQTVALAPLKGTVTMDKRGLGDNLTWEGAAFLRGAKVEWDGARQFTGFYVHPERVVHGYHVQNVPLLDSGELQYDAKGNPVFVRTIEFTEGSDQPLTYHLPVSAGKQPLIHSMHHADGLALERKDGSLTIRQIEPGAWLQILSSKQPTDLTVTHQSLADFTQGAPPRWPKTQTTAIIPNADPAANGTAYEIDDIVLPIDHHQAPPMVLCGLAFTPEGDAYVGTMTGDIWKVTGLNQNSGTVTWKLCARGLLRPMGLLFLDGKLHINVQDQMLVAEDRNGNEEFDFYRHLTPSGLMAVGGPGKCTNGPEQDAAGNFYFSSAKGIHRISTDGQKVEYISSKMRNPLGIAVRPDGLVLADASEGGGDNGASAIIESHFTDNDQMDDPMRRSFFFPRAIENSAGDRIFLDTSDFGPLGHHLIGGSHGFGTWYMLMRDSHAGHAQIALQPLPGNFAAGPSRFAMNPAGTHLYSVGLDGWGDHAVQEGALHRIRYTGKKALYPTDWQAHQNGILITFNHPVQAPEPDAMFAQWNCVDGPGSYGSNEYSVRYPEMIGHDRLSVTSVRGLADGKSLFFHVPDLLPAMCTQLNGRIETPEGLALDLDLYMTIRKLRENHPGAAPAKAKAMTLAVPRLENNGDTYARMREFFAARSGQALPERPTTAEVAWQAEELSYDWLKTNLLEASCFPCHMAGMPHDFSTYEKFTLMLNLEDPDQSKAYQMVLAESMPPYPLPKMHPSMREAFRTWLKQGAPEHTPSAPTQDDPAPATTSAASEDGFVSIFNGKDLEGWRVYCGRHGYHVKDGIITGTAKAGEKNGFLTWHQPVRNFELQFEVKCDTDLNSGCQIRSAINHKKRGHLNGPQVEIAETGWFGRVYGEGLSVEKEDGTRIARKWLSPAYSQEKKNSIWKSGAWNHYRILTEGPRYRVWVNGELLTDFEDPLTDLSGVIGLQVHSVPEKYAGLQVHWKNIRLKTLR